jgi:hypothetical protein
MQESNSKHCLLWLLMLYWALLENVINVVRDQKVGTTLVLQDVQERIRKVHENLSGTWAKP